MSVNPQPIVLTGQIARLEPLDPRHADDLFEFGRDTGVWTWTTQPAFRDIEDTREWIAAARDLAAQGLQIPFAIIDAASGRAIGSTRYLDIRRADRGIEIGFTWIARPFQRTAVNTECKFLLLRHAFETLGCVRVQLKTDLRNLQSQRAIERLGAVREGVLRKYQLTQNDFMRDTLMYSIIDDEWPAVRARLLGFLSRQS